jgi:hypothetical protein
MRPWRVDWHLPAPFAGDCRPNTMVANTIVAIDFKSIGQAGPVQS